ncbi:MAG: response regulator [Hymenobacter sp.]|nr:MAG: response regulator [Hymenobacter sp.]
MKTPKLAYVVEDDRITAAITELTAKKDLRCRVVKIFGNGQLAFDHLVATAQAGGNVPDLILLDLNMPIMDGWEFLDALGNLSLQQPMCVFVLTSSIHPDDMAKATHYEQVKGYFSKPLDKPNVARMQGLLQEVGGYQYAVAQ